MNTQDFTLHFLVDQAPSVVFQAVNHVRGWWSEELEGDSGHLHDEFTYRHKDMHVSRQAVTELVPDRRVVWLVTDSHLSFLKGNQHEWTGSRIVFDISRQGEKTTLRFTHEGLRPGLECYGACSNGWNHYLQNSLRSLIETGTGKPDRIAVNTAPEEMPA